MTLHLCSTLPAIHAYQHFVKVYYQFYKLSESPEQL